MGVNTFIENIVKHNIYLVIKVFHIWRLMTSFQITTASIWSVDSIKKVWMFKAYIYNRFKDYDYTWNRTKLCGMNNWSIWCGIFFKYKLKNTNNFHSCTSQIFIYIYEILNVKEHDKVKTNKRCFQSYTEIYKRIPINS